MANEPKQKEGELQAVNKNTALANAGDFDTNSIEGMMALGEKIVKSGLTPLKTAEAVMSAILMGKALGLNPMVAVNNIYAINGRAVTGVHIVTGLLLKAGVTYEIVKDHSPLYLYTDKSKNVYGERDVAMRKDLFQIVTPLTPKDQIDPTRTMVMLSPTPYDYESTIVFRRVLNGKELVFTVTRSLQDFKSLLGKDNWLNNPKTMLINRIIVIGGRLIADDAINGIYIPDELDGLEPVKAVAIPESFAKVETYDVPHTEEGEKGGQDQITEPITIVQEQEIKV